MKNFEKVYFKILKLDERDSRFLNSLKDYPKNLPYPAYDFKSDFINNCIVKEDKNPEINIGQSALGYLKSCLKKDIIMKINNEKLKSKLLTSWKYFNDFCIACMNVNLWMLEIDFNHIQKADKYIRKIDPNFSKKFGENNGSYGLTVLLDKHNCVILFDYNAFKNEKELQHEFTHYVQIVTGKLIKDNVSLIKRLKECIGVDSELIDYICNPFEFWTHIYNDLFNGLQKIYWLKFKDIYDWDTFIEVHFNDLRANIFDLKNAVILKLWMKFNGNKNSFYFPILAGISFVDKELFNEIKRKLVYK